MSGSILDTAFDSAGKIILSSTTYLYINLQVLVH